MASKKSSLVAYIGQEPSALLKRFAEVAQDNYPAVVVKPYKSASKGYEPNRVLTVELSDLHIGTDLNAAEHLQAFSNVEEARRLAAVLKNVLDFKTDKRDRTALQILLNGDLFAGLLGHDDRAVDLLTSQMLRTAHLITQFVAQCCAHFASVTVRFQPGNHGRNKLRHFARADNAKWDNFETMTMMVVIGQFRGVPNVRWDIPRRPVSFWKVFGHQFGMTHGDTVAGKKPGTPSLSSALAEVKASSFYNLRGTLDVFFLGHWHKGIMEVLGDTTVFCNPALVPPDGHSESSGYLNACGQWLVETTPDYPVGDCRLVRVGAEQDRDRSLDSLISPWAINMAFPKAPDEEGVEPAKGGQKQHVGHSRR